jgi:hypothetical protein
MDVKMKFQQILFLSSFWALAVCAEAPSITGKSVLLESTDNFTILGDESTTTGTKNGVEFREVKQLNTKRVAFYPSGMTRRGNLASTGYEYICEVVVDNPDWHPSKNKMLLGNIGYQLGKGLEVKLRSTSDAEMKKAGPGMVNLLQGDSETITLILLKTEDENRFHLCATYTVTLTNSTE